jgi:hypothetical protein
VLDDERVSGSERLKMDVLETVSVLNLASFFSLSFTNKQNLLHVENMWPKFSPCDKQYLHFTIHGIPVSFSAVSTPKTFV